MTLITKTLNLRRTSYPQITDFASEHTTLEFSNLNFEGDYDHTDKKSLGLLGYRNREARSSETENSDENSQFHR